MTIIKLFIQLHKHFDLKKTLEHEEGGAEGAIGLPLFANTHY